MSSKDFNSGPVFFAFPPNFGTTGIFETSAVSQNMFAGFQRCYLNLKWWKILFPDLLHLVNSEQRENLLQIEGLILGLWLCAFGTQLDTLCGASIDDVFCPGI